ncbi:MAG: RluA family pseudouridine synthase [Syntrophorhabdaceae bacterium]|nr:RluA family pseudouridine synthase [Syntrophorhabdaceae bacterium]
MEGSTAGTFFITVPSDQAGERIDRYLPAAFPGLSRATVQRLIGEGNVLLFGAIPRPSHKLSGGEEISVTIPPPSKLDLAPEDLPLSILHEDAHLLVVEKPAGMVVHPAPGHAGGTLVNALLSRADTLSGIGGVSRPGIVHRLDRDTSGILVVAKTDAAHRGLSAQLSARSMKRGYHGIVFGSPPAREGLVNTRIGRHPVCRKKMAVLAEGGRLAVTHYRRLAVFGPFSLLEFRLETGRTHQVRVHCAHIRCPIVGDDVYGRPRKIVFGKGACGQTATVSRYFLHAFQLGFTHPVTGETLEFTVPDPPEFSTFRAAVEREYS